MISIIISVVRGTYNIALFCLFLTKWKGIGFYMVEYQGQIFNCPMELAVRLISGKWKVVILWNLAKETLRFSELCRRFPEVSEKVLTAQLKSLEKDGMIVRTVYPEVPVRVEYSLSVFGKTLIPILNEINIWGTGFHGMKSL
jgi:DNA-binding HxlR family transcriptional regulator